MRLHRESSRPSTTSTTVTEHLDWLSRTARCVQIAQVLHARLPRCHPHTSIADHTWPATMKMTTTEHVGDSDSGNSPTDDEKNDEKKIGVAPGGFETLAHGELPPDPDAGLSAAEKARVVRPRNLTRGPLPRCMLTRFCAAACRTRNCCWDSTSSSSPGSVCFTSWLSSTGPISAMRGSTASRLIWTSRVASTMPRSPSSSSRTRFLSRSPTFSSSAFVRPSSSLPSWWCGVSSWPPWA